MQNLYWRAYPCIYFSISTCVSTLAGGYSVKARGIARDIFGTEKNYVIPVQSLEHEDDLVNAFKYTQENEESIKSTYRILCHHMQRKPGKLAKKYKKLIEN